MDQGRERGLKKDERFKIYLQNIVAFVDLAAKLDLDRLLYDLPGTGYESGAGNEYGFNKSGIQTECNPRFPALIVKFKEPKVSFLLFRNGKMNVTGAKKIADLKEAVSKLVNRLRSLGIDVKKHPKVTVTNQVCTVDLGLDLNLDEIALNVENVEYEPETFPGLVYRPYDWPHNSKPSILVFANGKLVIAGVRKLPEARWIVEQLVETLTETGLIEKR